MKIKIALPGDKYYLVPVEVFEKYSVSQEDFETSMENDESIFDDDVTGQYHPVSSGKGRSSSGGYRTAALGIRG